MLNNRELASVIWLGVILVAASLSGSVRSSLWQLVKVALHWKLLLVWGGFAAVLTATVYWLRRADLTYADSTKDAVVWAVIVGIPLLFKAHDKCGAPGQLRATVVDAVALTALVEFFVNLYVFPIWVELMLQPVVVPLVLLHEVSVPGTDDRPVDARKLLGRLVALIGAVLLVIVAVHVFGDVGPYTTRATLLSFVQPVILSFVVIAFAFLVALLAEYESTFVRVGWHKAPSRRVRLAKLALLLGLGFRTCRGASSCTDSEERCPCACRRRPRG